MQIKIGEVVKSLRRQKNITQETLAEYLAARPPDDSSRRAGRFHGGFSLIADQEGTSQRDEADNGAV